MNYMQWKVATSFQFIVSNVFKLAAKMKSNKTDLLEDLSNTVLDTFSCVYFRYSLLSVSTARFKYPLHGGKYPTLVPFTVNEEGLRHLCKPLARELTVH